MLGDFSLDNLHQVIQYTMGWQNSHLYDFEIGGVRFSESSEFEDELPEKPLNTKLTEGLKGLQKFSYNYDFGDGWRHEIAIEETMLQEEFMQYPLCIAGENACPPEDCGGPPGYDELKNKIADTEDEDHFETLRWLGRRSICF